MRFSFLLAIPSLFFYRFFTRRVDELLNIMEQEALKLVEVLSSDITNRGDLSRHLGQEVVSH